jgi:2-methylisocitrate lyase-like PEP mutase family enzyme
MTTSVPSFRALHTPATLLVLPNAWDAGSARLFEAAGAPAIATTSAGVAWARGHRDGNQMPVEAVHALARELARVVRVPVSVDLEAGYSGDPQRVAENVAPLLDSGIAGINIEDGSDGSELLERKLAAIRDLVAKRGVDLFVNARTDVYLRGLVPTDQRVAETLRRAAGYQAAGADGIFVPGVAARQDIEAICRAAALPVNVMAVSGLPALDELRALGVSRLSAGSGLAQLVWARAEALARDFVRTGDSAPFAAGAKSYPELQALFPEA